MDQFPRSHVHVHTTEPIPRWEQLSLLDERDTDPRCCYTMRQSFFELQASWCEAHGSWSLYWRVFWRPDASQPAETVHRGVMHLGPFDPLPMVMELVARSLEEHVGTDPSGERCCQREAMVSEPEGRDGGRVLDPPARTQLPGELPTQS